MIKFEAFVKERDNAQSIKELYELLSFFETVIIRLEQEGEIDLVTFAKWKNYKTLFENNEEIDDYSVVKTDIGKTDKKIEEYFKGKEEWEFISDYFTRGDTENYSGKSNKVGECKENEYEKIEKMKLSINRTNSLESFFDLLQLSSKEFLKSKVDLNDEQIEEIKGEECEIETKAVISTPDQSIKEKKSEIPKLSKVQQIKSLVTNKPAQIDKIVLNPKETSVHLEKEMDKEVINDIFAYTKNMKNYARNFNEILTGDSRKLEKIEKIQEKDKIKTDSSINQLNYFNNTLKIGFWRLLLMFGIVIVTFMTTLVSIRIFPKLVN
jgi:hypothetical protein